MSKELGTLVIVVLKAQHLIDNHTFYKQDPYAKLSLSGATKQTPVDPKGGQHPVWDAELRFPISKDPSKSNRTLTISVFSEEKKEDQLLGEGSVDITDTLNSGEFDGAPTFSLPSCRGLNIVIDWVPLSLKGTQRGDVYLEMTFFAAGPAPLTRRPSKFTSPSERLAQPQQLNAQRPQRVASQPQPSLLTPGGQGSRANSYELPRQGRPKVQQVPLPGSWPGRSAQQQQQPQPAAPSHHNRRSSKSEDAPLPPLPQDQDAEPRGEFLPSILRPGGPSRPIMHAMQNTRMNPPDTHAQERYQAGTPSTNGTAGQHHIPPRDTDPNTYPTHPHPHAIHQNTVPFHGSPAPQANIHSPPPQAQPHARPVSSYPTQETTDHIGFSSGGYATTQPAPQAQPQFTHAQYNSQPQPPAQQWHQAQHSPRQQAQSPVGHPGHATSPHPPDSHPAQPYVATPGPPLPGQSYFAASNPSPPSHSYVQPQTISPPAPPQISTQQGPPPVSHAQPYAAVQSPVLSARPFVASPSPGPSAPPTQPYANVSSPIPPSQPYATSPVPAAQPYTAPTNAVQQTQPYISPVGSNVSPHVHSPPQQATPSPPVQSYISPPNHAFPLPTSPPPMPPYGPSYAPAQAPSFPAPSFPVPQAAPDYFETPPTSPFTHQEDADLPDPYLLRRYQTPLPLPPGVSRPQGPDRNAKAKPKPSPPHAAVATAPAPAPVVNNTWQGRREDESERAARELQRFEEEKARARREQEERDAELARTLDLQLNAEG